MKKKTTGAKKKSEKELWVWMLEAYDLTEAESEKTLWYDHDKAKAAMEKNIKFHLELHEADPEELDRDSDDHVILADYMIWTIEKVKVN